MKTEKEIRERLEAVIMNENICAFYGLKESSAMSGVQREILAWVLSK